MFHNYIQAGKVTILFNCIMLIKILKSFSRFSSEPPIASRSYFTQQNDIIQSCQPSHNLQHSTHQVGSFFFFNLSPIHYYKKILANYFNPNTSYFLSLICQSLKCHIQTIRVLLYELCHIQIIRVLLYEQQYKPCISLSEQFLSNTLLTTVIFIIKTTFSCNFFIFLIPPSWLFYYKILLKF